MDQAIHTLQIPKTGDQRTDRPLPGLDAMKIIEVATESAHGGRNVIRSQRTGGNTEKSVHGLAPVATLDRPTGAVWTRTLMS